MDTKILSSRGFAEGHLLFLSLLFQTQICSSWSGKITIFDHKKQSLAAFFEEDLLLLANTS